MTTLLAAPVVLPLFAAALLVLLRHTKPKVRHALGIAATAVFVLAAARLFAHAAGGDTEVLLLGNWRAPFGIVLVLDRLSAWMLLLTGIVGAAALIAAITGGQARALHFHALFQVQLAGVAGAFLTGDLFNLFVFFEVLLAASYGLLLYSGERQTRRASLHYIVFNLVGSLLFLIAAGLVYGLVGTLNLGELGLFATEVAPADRPLLRAALLLLLVVFCIKAAALPLGLWLPATYGAAQAPVAALFALLTKVGIYAVLRVFVGVLGALQPGATLLDLSALLPWVGALTLLFGAFGALAARHLRGIAASLVLASAGTLLLAAGLAGGAAAAIYYAAHSTLAGAALFLVADAVRRDRGEAADVLVPAPAAAHAGVLGSLFFFVAVAVASLPPLSGFIGKTMLLGDLVAARHGAPLTAAVLLAGLTTIIALARAGSVLFWETVPAATAAPRVGRRLRGDLAGLGVLLAGLLALVLFAGPAQRYAGAAAAQLADPAAAGLAVLAAPPRPQPGRTP
jgi:multicomponent K+:H+ antiporter subunit D